MSLEDFDEDFFDEDFFDENFENDFDTIKSDNSDLTFIPFIPILVSACVIIVYYICNT